MKKSKLYIAGFESSPIHPHIYNLIIASDDYEQKRLHIMLNQYEAQVISHIFSGGRKNQLFAFGSFTSIFHTLDIKINKIELQKAVSGQLSAQVYGSGPFGGPFKSTVRPVDAIIFCLLNKAPIYYEELLVDEEPQDTIIEEEIPLEDLSLGELQKLLDDYLAVENYEDACIIRDLMRERKQKIA